MPTITTRVNKDSELTFVEGDNNISRDIEAVIADPTPDETKNRTTFECTGTFDFTLPLATDVLTPNTNADDYELTVKNVSTGVITVKSTSADTIEGVAFPGSYALNENEGATFKVNSAADGYIVVISSKVSVPAISPTTENNAVIQNASAGIKDAGYPLATVDVNEIAVAVPSPSGSGTALTTQAHSQSAWTYFNCYFIPKVTTGGLATDQEIAVASTVATSDNGWTFNLDGTNIYLTVTDSNTGIQSPDGTKVAVNGTNFSALVRFVLYTALP